MPMVATALEKMIRTKLKAIPIAKAPKKTSITTTPNGDGTVETVSTPGTSVSVYMDDGTVDAIAKAVAESVVTFLKTSAVATGSNGGGAVISKIT